MRRSAPAVATITLVAALRSATASTPPPLAPLATTAAAIAPAPTAVSPEPDPPLPPPRPDRRVVSALTLGGLYAGFVAWTYLAWYRGKNHAFRTGGDGSWQLWGDDSWLSSSKYAGGADKFGHAWINMVFARGGTELLHRWGGFERTPAALVAAGLSSALFLGVEIKDGFAYSFSYGDLSFNLLGAGMGLAQSLSPTFDRAVDFRVQYWPSAAYRRQFVGGNVNVAEDYSGQTYLLAYHLGSIGALRESRYLGWTRFVDVTLGFETRGYKPDPPYEIDPNDPARQDYPLRQTSSIGLSLNAQALFDWLLRGRSEPLRQITHGTFEVFNVPATNLPVLRHAVTPDGQVPSEQ